MGALRVILWVTGSARLNKRALSITIWAALLAAIILPYTASVPSWRPLVEIKRDHPHKPSTRALVREFQVSSFEDSHRLSVESDTRKGLFSIVITGNNASSRYDVWSGHRRFYQVYSDRYGLRPGKTYSLRIEETGFAGSYRVKLYPTADQSTWKGRIRAARASWASFVLAALTLGLIIFCRLYRYGESSGAPMVLLAGFVPLLDTIYGVVHELGHHVIDLYYLGGADFASSDYLGISGRTFAALAVGDNLNGWQHALRAISGLVLPGIAGCLMFAGIMLIRKRSPRFVTTFWGAWLLMVMLRLLLPQVMLIPIVFGVIRDGHYGYFVQHCRGSVLVFNLLLMLFAVLNTVLGAAAVRWFLLSLRNSISKQDYREAASNNATEATGGME